MPEQEAYSGDGGAEVTILDAGRATLEIANSAQADMIDEVEVGRRVAPHFRVALEVDDCAAASERATDGGAVPVAPPTPYAVELPERPLRRARRGAPDAVPGAGARLAQATQNSLPSGSSMTTCPRAPS